MTRATAKVVNTKLASIRRDPWIVTAEGTVVKTIAGGSQVTIDTENVVYDYRDVKYYAVLGILGAVDGYISEEVIQIQGG